MRAWLGGFINIKKYVLNHLAMNVYIFELGPMGDLTVSTFNDSTARG